MINWLKKNWLISLLLLIILLLGKDKFFRTSLYSSPSYLTGADIALTPKNSSLLSREAPPTESQDRLVIKNTNLSLVVKDVSKTISQIESLAKSFGGFLVDSSLNKPESAANGTITVRVPQDKLSEALNEYKNLAVKVVSESVYGQDVTDEYVDLEARLEVLNKTKTKFEEIMDKAYAVQDLLSVQRELINLQSQIDSIKGQQKYYTQSAKLSKITVYLSTDELALPYAPTNQWRPLVVIKQAVRSLIADFQHLANAIIWLVVYSPIWVPLFLLFLFFKKRLKPKQT